MFKRYQEALLIIRKVFSENNEAHKLLNILFVKIYNLILPSCIQERNGSISTAVAPIARCGLKNNMEDLTTVGL
ncbi:MAG: hypothetical protein ACP5KW_04000 [Thermoproteota archaeon]